MKKLCFIAISAVLCIGLALPAMAAVTVGGLITMDAYYYSLAEEPDGAGNDMKTTQFATYYSINYIRVRYVNDAQTVGGQFTMYFGRWNDDNQPDNVGGNLSGLFDVGGLSYIWYKPMPALELKIGQIPQIVAGKIGPPTHLKGHGIIVLITYGALSSSARQGISGAYKVNDMVSVEVGLYDPDDDGTPAIAGYGSEETVIPRLDFAVPIRFKAAGASILVNPVGSINPKSIRDVTGDDSFTVTVLGLETQAKFGPVTGTFEIASVTNLAGGDSYTSGLLGPDQAGGSITDSGGLLWWLAAEYKFNPKNTLALFYGSQEEDRGTLELTGRSSYGIRHTYRIAPNFLIFPHLQWFVGHDTEISGVTVATGQTAMQLGVNFYLVF
jgi:hypothetical protein